MHHDGRVYPSNEELVIFYDVAGNEHQPVTIEAWNDGIARGIFAWKHNFAEGVECAYSIVRLLRSMIIRDGERTISH